MKAYDMTKKQASVDEQSSEKVGEFVAIYERGGVWYVNYQHKNRQVRKSLKTRSKKEARRRALMLEKEILAGEHKHLKQPPLVTEVVTQYLDYLRAEGRTSKTIEKYRFCFDILIDLAASRRVTRISQVSIALIDKYRAERAKGAEDRKPAKPKTIHNDTVTIRQLVNFALKRGMVQDDPLKGLEIKKPKRTPQPCWTKEEMESIVAGSEPPHRDPLIFLAETGARVGEAKWLTWQDVDFQRKLIHIRPKEGWKPKSGDARVVPMSPRLMEMLRARPQTGTWVFSARVTRRNPEANRQISERRLLQYLKRVLKPLGLHGHLHTFRHSFISFAAYNGVSERVLRQWIGHVDREVLDWYFHLADTQSQAAMQRLAEVAATNQRTIETDSPSAQFQHTSSESKNENSAK